jgi:hypothetical protein
VHRYGGTDPVIRRRLAELGYSHLCDHPLDGHPVVLRNHVRFSLNDVDQATDVARHLLSMFAASWKDGECTKVLSGSVEVAEFGYAHSAKDGKHLQYTIERLRPLVAGNTSAVYRDPVGANVWLLAEDGPYPPIGLHEILRELGATDIRWFSRDEWNSRALGAALPY